jgi:hypothetical protein
MTTDLKETIARTYSMRGGPTRIVGNEIDRQGRVQARKAVSERNNIEDEKAD